MPLREFEFEYEFEYEGEYEGEQMIRRLLSGARQLGGRILSSMASRGSTPQQEQQPAAQQPSRPRGRGVVQSVGRRLIPTLVRLMATNQPQDPALPPPEPVPVVAQDERKRGGAGSPPEGEFEFEYEFEFADAPRGRMTPPTLMRYLAREAERAQSEDEAEAFIGALVPLAAQAIPRAAPAVMRVAPQLISGLSQAASAMRRDPRTRPLVRQLPAVVQRTAASLAQRAAQGGAVTPATATRSLARQLAYQHSLAMRAKSHMQSEAEYMAAKPRTRRKGNAQPSSQKQSSGTLQKDMREAAEMARLAKAHFQRTIEILRDANANKQNGSNQSDKEYMW